MINLSNSQVTSYGHTLFTAFVLIAERDAVMRRASWPDNLFIWCYITEDAQAEFYLVSDTAISLFEPAPDDYLGEDWIVISAE